MISEDAVFKKAATLCARQEYCEHDLLMTIKKWGVEAEIAQQTMVRLKRENYVDNARFAGSYARDKCRFNGWGKVKIAANLRQKRVEDETIRQAINTIEDNGYLEILRNLLQQKYRTVKKLPPLKLKAALINHALSRGFSGWDIKIALGELRLLSSENSDPDLIPE